MSMFTSTILFYLHVTSALRELHWLPLEQRIQYKLCLLVHKTLIGHAPMYLSDLLTSAVDVYPDDPLFERQLVVTLSSRVQYASSVIERSVLLLLEHGTGFRPN